MKYAFWASVVLTLFLLIQNLVPKIILKSVNPYPGSIFIGQQKTTWPDSHPSISVLYHSTDHMDKIILFYRNTLKPYEETNGLSTFGTWYLLKFHKFLWSGSVYIEDQKDVRRMNIKIEL